MYSLTFSPIHRFSIIKASSLHLFDHFTSSNLHVIMFLLQVRSVSQSSVLILLCFFLFLSFCSEEIGDDVEDNEVEADGDYVEEDEFEDDF
ncbi:hypothetical protein L195_g032040 [Trifolium pratense]|uniref:Uncharacterized protein n=1 Tax=Trifolium pratense TaxID=57577 RepID=A0A2K3LC25_TRIPR|nr:hypothetical protein L195_g032040 [Trifolium pratense]